MEMQKTQSNLKNLKKILHLDLKVIIESYNSTIWCFHINRNIGEWDKIEIAEVFVHICDLFIFSRNVNR